MPNVFFISKQSLACSFPGDYKMQVGLFEVGWTAVTHWTSGSSYLGMNVLWVF